MREELDELVRRRRFFGLSDNEDKRYRELIEREHELLEGEGSETSPTKHRFRWR